MWLLEPTLKHAIEHSAAPTAEQQAQYVASYGAYESGPSRILSVAGDTAEIRVSGAITKAPSLLAMLFGGGNVTYPEIIGALAEAEKNPQVKRIEMRIDSGGGHIDGLFDTLAAVQARTKPLRAVVSNKAASAAYALASQADEIVATNRATRFGSIGVAAAYGVDDVRTVEIASTNAPKKRPDVRTEEGKAVVREELDAMHEIFVEAIAGGRKTTTDKINADYGQGATLLADEALKRGMIDAISVKKPNPAAGGKKPETGAMDLNTLRAQHPDVYAAAVQEGVTQERDRASAHLTMGEASGDMATAIAAVSDGSAMTATLQAKYLAAGLNRRDMQNRQVDDGQTAAAVSGATATTDAANEVLALVEAQLGIGG